MKIKFITTILLLCMPILTLAASWADNGSYDVSWYKKSQTEFQNLHSEGVGWNGLSREQQLHIV